MIFLNRPQLVSLRAIPRFVLLLLPLFAWQTSTEAGIGPENVILVVNGSSHESRTVANHYVAMREIPASNVIVLNDVPDGLKVSLDDFLERILRPLLDQISERKLAKQIGVIAYSVGFPTSVEIGKHLDQMSDETIIKYQKPLASITGLTFFFRFMLADDPNYLQWHSNLYARGKFERHFQNPFNGEKKERFEEAVDAYQSEEFAESADIYAALFEEYPTLSPLAIRAAEAHARNGDEASARDWIAKAIVAGWWSASYLEQSEALKSVIQDERVERVIERLSDAPITMQGPVGFSTLHGFTGSGHWVKPGQGGVHYMLSCMLGVVHPRGSTVEQVIDHLSRSADADLTHPKAVFGFAKTEDVRTKTRFPNFADALVWLTERGKQTEVFSSSTPSGDKRYAGLMLGTANLSATGSSWQLVPGAIAESLTSHAGNFATSGQTKLTELLHAGASMSSGTVTEPYSLQYKFPLPIMHAYYAEGVTAVEAFYLSVMSPYQLLIVGDPICQPFARPPSEMITMKREEDEGNRVRIERKRLPIGAPSSPTRRIELYLEGKLVNATTPKSSIQMNLPDSISGVMQLRVALVGADPTDPRISFSEEIELAGPHVIPSASLKDTTSDATEDSRQVFEISVSCEGADSVSLQLGQEEVGKISGAEGTIKVDPKRWGDGPLRLRPVAQFGESKVPGRYFFVNDEI